VFQVETAEPGSVASLPETARLRHNSSFHLIGCYMDNSHFNFKLKSTFVEEGRKILNPLKEAVFPQAGGVRPPLKVLVGKLEQLLGSSTLSFLGALRALNFS
jgi:hypothetical protein